MADGPDLSEIVRRTVQANARFYKGWMDLTFEYWRGIAGILGGTPVSDAPVQEMDAGASAVVLEGEAGSVVRGSFLVSNDMEKPVSCAFSSSDFRDPRGSSVPAKASFEPAAVQLAPGEQRVVQVAITVEEALTAGVGYAGEIFIQGMDGFSVPVVLRRTHRLEERPLREPPDDAPALEEKGASAPGRRSGKKDARHGSVPG